MNKKLKIITLIIAAYALSTAFVSDLSARSRCCGRGGRGWHRRGYRRHGYWGGPRWGVGFGWGYRRHGGFWGGPRWGVGAGWGYPSWRHRYYRRPYPAPYNYPSYDYRYYGTGQIPAQTADTETERPSALDSEGKEAWTMKNRSSFPIKVATDSEIITLQPGEQKQLARAHDFTFTAEGGGVSRQFASRDHEVVLDQASFGIQENTHTKEKSYLEDITTENIENRVDSQIK